MNKLLVVAVGALFAGAMTLPALAAESQSVKNQVSTANAHALMAQGATTLDMAHAHLHHVINCLVGPSGIGFDASAENPCKGQGTGAIPDSKGDTALQGKLQSALTTAQAGLKSNDLATVQADAGKVSAALGATPAQKSSGAYSW